MHWDGYTIFSIISGAALLIMAFLPGESVKDRLSGLAVGVGFIIYAVYVAKQTSGTYYFPVVIFILPFLVAIKMIASLVKGTAK